MKRLNDARRVWGMILTAVLIVSGATLRADLLLPVALNRSGFVYDVLRFDGDSGTEAPNLFSASLGTESIQGARVGPDGNLYLQGNGVGYAGIFKISGQSGQLIGSFYPSLGPSSDWMPATAAVAFTPDGRAVAACRPDPFGESSGSIWILAAGDFGVMKRYEHPFLNSPTDLVCLPDGRFLVADSRNGLLLGHPDSAGLSKVAVSVTNNARMVLGPAGNLYVSRYESNAVYRFDAHSYTNSPGAPPSFPLIDVFIPPDAGGLSGPTYMAFGPDGNFYVLSWNTKSVLRYDGQTGTFLDVFAEITQDLSSPIGTNGRGIAGMVFTPRVPVLRSTRTAEGFVLNWPRSWTNYVLETQSDATATNGWTVVSDPPSEIGTNMVVTNAISAPMQFFRLKRMD